jgi:hypothetical protein
MTQRPITIAPANLAVGTDTALTRASVPCHQSAALRVSGPMQTYTRIYLCRERAGNLHERCGAGRVWLLLPAALGRGGR